MNSEPFLLERYKYVLEQKRTLNDTTFKIVSLFQIVVAALIAGDYEVIKSSQSHAISSATAHLAINVLYAGFLIATLGCLCLLIGGIVSWLDYRADESAIELAVHGEAKPKLRLVSALRWYETYIALTMIAAIAAYTLALPIISRESERSTKTQLPVPPGGSRPIAKVNRSRLTYLPVTQSPTGKVKGYEERFKSTQSEAEPTVATDLI